MRVRGYADATPCWWELVCSDRDAAASFYGELLGWQRSEDGVAFRVNEYAVAGLSAAPSVQPAYWLTYINTEDVSAAVGRVTSAGGTVLSPPAQVGTRGHSAVVADREGARFGMWQRGSFAGAQLVNEAGTVCWSELACRDAAGAASFYGSVFGWSDNGGIASGLNYLEWVAAGRTVARLAVLNGQVGAEEAAAGGPASGVRAQWRPIIEVDDCEQAVARCLELGGRVHVGPLDLDVGRYAQLFDPQNATFGVIELTQRIRDLVR